MKGHKAMNDSHQPAINSESGEDSAIITIRLDLKIYDASLSFHADGTGKLSDREGQEFKHGLNLNEVRALFPEQRGREEYLTEYFWDEINDDLKYPLVPDPLAGRIEQDTYFEWGSEAELLRVLRLIALSSFDPKSMEVRIKISYETWPDLEDWEYDIEVMGLTDGAVELIDVALEENAPRGGYFGLDPDFGSERAEYREEWDAKYQGVDLSYDLSDCLTASEVERAQARRDLVTWLEELGRDPAEFGLADDV